jgi:1-acyl-sn-glycerol-3-phosphate acyltransferase
MACPKAKRIQGDFLSARICLPLARSDEDVMDAIRAGAILAIFLLVTVILMPLQALGVMFGLRFASTLPNAYHRFVAWLFGIHVHVIGEPVRGRGVLLLANHTSWLDIVIFSAVMPLSFVAKSEVADWPFFGHLAKLQRTIFVSRTKRSETGQARDLIRERLVKGEALVLFPEGTSSDGNAVLPFKSALLGAVGGTDSVTVQPVSTAYTGIHGIPMGRENRPLFAWYGDMELVPHLWEALKAGPLDVVVEFHPPLVAADRKELAKQAEKLVREGHIRALAGSS